MPVSGVLNSCHGDLRSWQVVLRSRFSVSEPIKAWRNPKTASLHPMTGSQNPEQQLFWNFRASSKAKKAGRRKQCSVVSSDDKCLHARQMMNRDITTTNINPFRLTTRHCLLAVDCLQAVLDIAKYLLLLLFWLMLVVIVAFAAAIYYCYC